MSTCTYCGSALEQYDPLVLQRHTDEGRSEEGRFCNYGCLSAHIEEEGLVYGAVCHC